MSAIDTEVVVIGAGVMGLAAARALAQAGRDVVVCEQFELGHARGSSHGSSRIVRLSYPDERWVRFAQETFPLWRELEAECGVPLLDLFFGAFDDVLAIRRAAGSGTVEQTLAIALAHASGHRPG